MRDPLAERLRTYWNRNRYRLLMKLSKGIELSKGTVNLDVGCGENNLKELVGIETIGIDIELELLKVTNAKGGEVQLCDTHLLPYADEKFDAVFCLDVLEFSTRPKNALNEMQRVLKRKGYFFCVIPNDCISLRFFWAFWVRTYGKKWANRSINRFNKDTLIKFLREFFTVEDIQSANWGMITGARCIRSE